MSSKIQADPEHDRRYARLLELLNRLYSRPAAEHLARDLWQRAAQVSATPAAARNDCMLITYADSICSEETPPLQTLARFLRQPRLGLQQSFGRLHLLPFFPSSSDDGFAVVDYRMVDHHLGSWQDVADLAGDFDLMFDLVINHCSRENLWFADFISGREPGRRYFITLPEDSDVGSVARPRSTPLISSVHTYQGIRHVWNTFSDDQIDLDFSNPDVLREFADILFFYVSRGAQLIRLDAIGYLWKRLGTTCLNLPEVHGVVQVLRLLLEAAGTDVKLVTETNVPHDENIAYFGRGDEAHLIYQFSLAPLLLYSFAFQDSSYLTTWAARLAPPPAGAAYLNFIASHDGFGLRPLVGLVPEANVQRLVDLMHQRGGFVTLRDAGGGDSRPYEINISLMSAFGGEAGLAAYLAAHGLLISFQGTPALYIHSLLGTLNDLDLVEQTGRTRSINRSRWTLPALQAQLADPQSLHARVLAAVTDMLNKRAQQPALQAQAQQVVLPGAPGYFVMRRRGGGQTLLVICSLLPRVQQLSISPLGLHAGVYADRFAGVQRHVAQQLMLAPYEVLWLELPET